MNKKVIIGPDIELLSSDGAMYDVEVDVCVDSLSPVSGPDYNNLRNKPSINGVTVQGSQLASVYDIASVYQDTTANWTAQSDLVSGLDTLYIYKDYEAVGSNDYNYGVKIGDGNTLLKDLPFVTDVQKDKIAWFHGTFNDEYCNTFTKSSDLTYEAIIQALENGQLPIIEGTAHITMDVIGGGHVIGGFVDQSYVEDLGYEHVYLPLVFYKDSYESSQEYPHFFKFSTTYKDRGSELKNLNIYVTQYNDCYSTKDDFASIPVVDDFVEYFKFTEGAPIYDPDESGMWKIAIPDEGVTPQKIYNAYKAGKAVFADVGGTIYNFVGPLNSSFTNELHFSANNIDIHYELMYWGDWATNKWRILAEQLVDYTNFDHDISILYSRIDSKADASAVILAPSSASIGDVLTYSSDGWSAAALPSGTLDYENLNNKPSINNVTLSSNKSLHDLGAEPEAFPVTITKSGSTYSSNKTYAQIDAALTAGKRAYAVYGDQVFDYIGKSSVLSINTVEFGGFVAGIGNRYVTISISSSSIVVTFSTKTIGDYSKPALGIPKADLASAVQSSLNKADTALQSAPVTSVNGQTGAVTLSIPSAGIPSGGTSGQVLKKSSGTDYDVAWGNESVAIFNIGINLNTDPAVVSYGPGNATLAAAYNAGQTILTRIYLYGDSTNCVGLAELINRTESQIDNGSWVFHGFITLSTGQAGFYLSLEMEDDVWGEPMLTPDESTLKSELDDKYEKPSGGIPATDLASAVQSSLDAADAAIPAPANPSSAQELVYLNGAWVAADKLYIVNCTPTALDYSGTMDKTVAEIYAAHQEGKTIVFRVWAGLDTYMDVVSAYQGSDGSTYPSFNAYCVFDHNLIMLYTETTNDGTEATYDTIVYPLSIYSCIPAPASPSTGDLLQYNGNSWAAASISATNIGAISDPGGTAENQILTYSSNGWHADDLYALLNITEAIQLNITQDPNTDKLLLDISPDELSAAYLSARKILITFFTNNTLFNFQIGSFNTTTGHLILQGETEFYNILKIEMDPDPNNSYQSFIGEASSIDTGEGKMNIPGQVPDIGDFLVYTSNGWEPETISIPSNASDVGAVSIAQGSVHAGEFVVVGSDGNITTIALSSWQGGTYGGT